MMYILFAYLLPIAFETGHKQSIIQKVKRIQSLTKTVPDIR